MIIERDLKGYLKWIVVDDNLTIVDPRWMYEYRMSVRYYVGKLLAM